MARLPALVDALAETDGRERPTLDFIARVLREEDLLNRSKRGIGASSMTSRDAANLLIAANAVQAPKYAALAVEQFRTFKQAPHGRRIKGRSLERISACDDFGEAAQVLIEEAGTINAIFDDWVRRAYDDGTDRIKNLTDKELALLRPELVVKFMGPAIRVEINRNGAAGPEQHLWLFQVDIDRLSDKFYTLLGVERDRRVITQISLVTLLSLHHALFSSDDEDNAT